MKIFNNPSVQKVMKSYGKNVNKVKSTEGVKFSKDKIEISDEAREFQVAKKAFDALPEVRQDKINSVKKQISSGTYKPSSREVAEKILSSLSDK
ncbi:flagellar biosynthesis anti-sigma factor FlgM [Helicovermis profundi]|uniref:Negative regulator of flagellin synthesis n=1 Tax=Helicovermis profundi TaxID=3065157 RepID=A0AAU9EHB3_9FIRM|nr:hypothetical protein HLPR_25430 [Clostridia bacterium S502]